MNYRVKLHRIKKDERMTILLNGKKNPFMMRARSFPRPLFFLVTYVMDFPWCVSADGLWSDIGDVSVYRYCLPLYWEVLYCFLTSVSPFSLHQSLLSTNRLILDTVIALMHYCYVCSSTCKLSS
jgi:hypothetical protein